MASASPNPYKSRIFNTVSQKSRQLLDQCDRLGRQVRLTASRATQVVLYPLYVLLQGVRVMGRQLKAQVNQGIPQLEQFVKSNEAVKPTLPAMGFVIPVYCSLAQVMGWVQASPIAVRMNLFGESALVHVAEVEENALAGTSPSLSSTIQPQAQSPLNSIQNLIWAAIDYFLNYPSSLLMKGFEEPSQTVLPPKEDSKAPQLTSGILQDMQQSSFPLFAGIGVGGFLVAATLTQYLCEDEPLEQVAEHFEPLGLTKEPESAMYLSSPVGTITANSVNSGQTSNENLEIPVTSAEYIKHPLVLVLEWVDQTVYWLEESLIKLWDWIVVLMKQK